jgi:hypothetical protein
MQCGVHVPNLGAYGKAQTLVAWRTRRRRPSYGTRRLLTFDERDFRARRAPEWRHLRASPSCCLREGALQGDASEPLQTKPPDGALATCNAGTSSFALYLV